MMMQKQNTNLISKRTYDTQLYFTPHETKRVFNEYILCKVKVEVWMFEFLKNKNSATSSCPSSSGVNTMGETRVLDLQPSVSLPTDEDPKTNVEHQVTTI